MEAKMKLTKNNLEKKNFKSFNILVIKYSTNIGITNNVIGFNLVFKKLN